MTYDDDSAIQFRNSLRLRQRGLPDSIRATNYELSTARIEMNIGHWYLDEYGNRTREIRARDAVEEVPHATTTRAKQPAEQLRAAVARLA